MEGRITQDHSCLLSALHLSQITKSVGIKCRRPKRISSVNENFILDYILDVLRQGIVMQQINNFLDEREGRVLEDLVTSVGCDGQGDLCQGRNGLTGI